MIEQLRRRRTQTRTQRRALATVLALQKHWTRAVAYQTPQPEPRYIGALVSLAAREAHKIDAMRVWDLIHTPDFDDCLCDECYPPEEGSA